MPVADAPSASASTKVRLGERTIIERDLVNPADFPAPASDSQEALPSFSDASAFHEPIADAATTTSGSAFQSIQLSTTSTSELLESYRTNRRGDSRTRRGTCLFAAFAAAMLMSGAAASPASAAPGQPSAVRAEVGQWFLAPSLAGLRAELDARWPGRSRVSDGSVGDARHQASDNGHNPVGHPNGPGNGTPGAVHALDITAAGIDVDAVLRAVIGDHRVHYVIHDGRIWSTTTGWAARVHSGDPHYSHIHISLRDSTPGGAVAAENDTSRWLSRSARPTRALGRVSARDSGAATGASLRRNEIRALQRALIARGYPIAAGPTGTYGPATIEAVAAFQRAQGWTGSAADGAAGPQTLALLGVAGQSTGSTATGGATPKPGSMTPGSRGQHVAQLQSALINRGFAIEAGATGYFGPATQTAVAAFQQAQGWSGSQADGIPGPMTLALLGL